MDQIKHCTKGIELAVVFDDDARVEQVLGCDDDETRLHVAGLILKSNRICLNNRRSAKTLNLIKQVQTG